MLYLLSRGGGSQSPQIETVILHFTGKILGDKKIIPTTYITSCFR